ncbi:hypothetical protein D3C86_1869430 [compost metagenome]
MFEFQVALFARRRIPVHHINVVAARQQELDQALALGQVEDGGLVGRCHDEQQRYPVNLV